MDPFTNNRLAVATQIERWQEADEHAPRRPDRSPVNPTPSKRLPGQTTLIGWRRLLARLSQRRSATRAV